MHLEGFALGASLSNMRREPVTRPARHERRETLPEARRLQENAGGGKAKLAIMRRREAVAPAIFVGEALTESSRAAVPGPGMDFPARVAYAIIAVALNATDIVFDTRGERPLVPTEQAKVFVHLLPKLIPPGSLRGGLAVVVDVLRATTVMVQALAAGCESIIPCGEIEEALQVAAGLPPGTALLAGERQGLPIPGFDLGNSPGEFTSRVCNDKTLVMTTTNGTRAILASQEAERVYIASFTNLRATSEEISVQFLKKDHGHSVHIVCAGTEGHISLEDSLLAGALVSQIADVSGITRGSQGRGAFRQRRSAFGCDPMARGGTISRKASIVEIAVPGTWRTECAGDRAVGRYRESGPF